MLATGLVLGLYDFEWKVTLGDILLGIVATLGSLVFSAYKFWLPRRPFVMRFYEKPWNTEDEDNPSTDSKIIHCKRGEPQKFLIGLRLRTQRTFKAIDIRVSERRWRLFYGIPWVFYDLPPKNTAKVKEIRDQEGRLFVGRGKGVDNKKHGVEATYEQIFDEPRGAMLWYEVTVMSENDWNGWLTFQLRRGSSHKGHAHAQLCFKLHS
jgi:hypothetical protein